MHSAIARTIARYVRVRSADRYYVSIKLRTDPLAAELLRISYPMGDVVDVGCGRGQFGLLLYELGQLSSLRGYDWDPVKIASAQAAAVGVAEYEVADLRMPPSCAADTVLLFDVLQYLTVVEQRQLLRQLVGTLRPGGRLLIRTSDRTRGWQAALSRWLERMGRNLRVNRSHTLEFRTSDELQSDLEALGLKVTRSAGGQSSLLDNRLFAAQK